MLKKPFINWSLSLKITRLTLVGYQRLQLNNINVFDYFPEKTNQLIIGTNGSGKSSIVKELSPLPAESSEYTKEGSKTIHLEHRGARYIAKSTFSPEAKHSLIRIYGDTEEELNKGGTITVQRELVKKEFGITKDIHELMMGKRAFTSMREGERKDWFTRLSNANYDYAIEVYQRIRERINDLTGAMKMGKKRIVIESNKILPEDARNQLRQEVNELHKVLDELLEQRRPIDTPLDAYDSALAANNRDLDVMSRKVKACLKRLVSDLPSVEVLEEERQTLQSHLRAMQMLDSQYVKKHSEISAIFDTLEKTHSQNIATIETDVAQLEKEKQENFEKRYIPVQFESSYSELVNALEYAKTHVTPIVDLIEPNPEKLYSRDSLRFQLETLETKKHERALLEKKVADNNHLLKHYESLRQAGEITCPNCDHKWINHYDSVNVEKTTLANQAYGEAISILDKEIENAQDFIERMRRYFEYYTAYHQCVATIRPLEPLWTYIQDNNFILTMPQHVSLLLVQLETDLGLIKRDEAINNTIREKLSLIVLTEQTAGINYDNCKQQKEELETTILNSQAGMKGLYSEIEFYSGQISARNELKNLEEKITATLANQDGLLRDSIETIRRIEYNDMIRHFQSILARKEQALLESDSQARLIDDIQQQITTYEFQIQALKLASKELSPTEGLIAEGLFGFMKVFVQRMNAVVKKIFTYPLVIKPCDLGSDNQVDLDYKFPMVVDNQEKPRKDVSEGSTAMCEVVNLAFRITGLKALHLGDFPLFLDEFGHSMDPTHKAATIHLINNIMTDEAFSQLFMISHDAIQYGALDNTQICVLCDANITIPKNTIYNEHVKIS